MTDYSNRRKHPRYADRSPCMYAYLSENPDCFYGGQLQNRSKGGASFISNYPLEPGALVRMRKIQNRLELSHGGDEKDTFMSVVWCKKLEGDDTGLYGIGVRRADTESISTPETKIDKEPEGAHVACENPHCQMLKAALDESNQLVETRSNELAALHRFGLSITSTLHTDEILKAICKEMVRIFNARNTGVGLLNGTKTTLRLVAFHSGIEGEKDATGMEIPVDGNAATVYVIQSGQTIVVCDVQNNPIMDSFHDIAASRGTHCIMIVPLISKGEVIGTIGLPTRDPDRVYTASDVALAQTIASQISSVIENARLYEETEKARDAAESELEIGRKIQSGFFPDGVPRIPGWEFAIHFQSARQVAGDFYDIFPLGNDPLIGLVVADVCDKGVGAALFMALFRTLIRATATQRYRTALSSGPSRIAEILDHTIGLTNDYIATTHENAGMFATVFFGILDPATGELTYINGGHQAPVLIGQNEIKAHLTLTGPALGMFSDVEFGRKQIRLDSEEALFICTDGITDAENGSGEFFSNDRLEKLLVKPYSTAEQLVDAVKLALVQHIESADQFDDITMMAVRRMISV